MIDNFKNLLKQYRIDNNLSQNDFVDIFILSNNFLLKLDTVTLSRWENGKTIPSIEKKMNIMRTLNLLSPYIDSIRGFDKITKVEEFINIRFGFESKQYERLNEIDTTHKIKFEHITDKKNLHTHIEKYLMPETIKLINIEPPLTLNVGHWFLNDRTEAFFIHMFVNENIYDNDYDYDYDNINSIIFLEQVASTRLFYKLCILSAFNTLLKHNHIDHIFSFIKTKFILKQALALGGKVITSINNRSAPPPNNEALLKHTIIVKIDIIKLLSNKDFLFFCLQSRVELEANNSKLLIQINNADF
jgi:transcriptional regulator with XRE-family HTH domain